MTEKGRGEPRGRGKGVPGAFGDFLPQLSMCRPKKAAMV